MQYPSTGALNQMKKRSQPVSANQRLDQMLSNPIAPATKYVPVQPKAPDQHFMTILQHRRVGQRYQVATRICPPRVSTGRL